jgi:hypothetical protein
MFPTFPLENRFVRRRLDQTIDGSPHPRDGFVKSAQLFSLPCSGLVAKNVVTRSNCERPFEHEETRPKHPRSRVGLASTQKEPKGRHNS